MSGSSRIPNSRKKKKGDTAFSLPKKKAKNGSRSRPPIVGGTRNESEFLHPSFIVEGGLFFIFIALVVMICFLGQKPKGPPVILNQTANERIFAEFPFTYSSEIESENRIRSVRAQVPPVYQRTYKPFEAFRNLLGDFNEAIAKSQIEHEDEGDDVVREKLEKTTLDLVESTEMNVNPEVIMKLTDRLTPRERSTLFNDSLAILRSLYDDGIYPSQISDEASGRQHVAVIQLVDEGGRFSLPNSRSVNEALVSLRVRINALSEDDITARSLFDVFKNGIEANLLYSERATNQAIERAVDQIEHPDFVFKEGDTLIEPGSMVDSLDIERIAAYRKAAEERGGNSLIFNELFGERLVMTTLLLIAVLLYSRNALRDVKKRQRTFGVVAVCILLNLVIIRLVIEVGEIALLNNRPTISMLPYVVPYALAPIMVSVLVGAAPAIFTSLIMSVLFGIIQNNSIEFFIIAFLSGVVGSFVATKVRKRSRMVRAGFFAGASAALASIIVGLLHELTIGLLGQQMMMALIVGLLTGVVAVGLLPMFEGIFKITTDITLLELTDFNHPLLRQMQVEAPGTYHHSLMVANLSENAAAEIGASPLLCRVCSFFHDIGKLVKPEYFVENQRGGINPHDEKNPSMSALVIKAHVKEGVEMAKQYQLPKVIIDVIQQHHGTGLIQFFYFQAQKRENENSRTKAPFSRKDGRTYEGNKVEESTYRYDGPRPAFKESAIIFFADSVEAASRSLKKVTQPAIEELIDNIFRSRIEDGQLDKCPLTFMELDLIKKSFVFTLLNMLHSRMEYPKGDPAKEGAQSEKESSDKSDTNDSLEQEAETSDATGNQQPV